MKKTAIFTTTLLSSILLSSCAGGLTGVEPVPTDKKITSVCLEQRRTRLQFTQEQLHTFFANSLKQQKGISVVAAKAPYDNCQYLLRYNLGGKRNLIVKGTVWLVDWKNDKETLGRIDYKYRSDEKARAKAVGLQGQLDLIIANLFQNQ